MTDDGRGISGYRRVPEQITYRRRRLIDSARALPFLGVLLWTVPLLWGSSGDGSAASSALIYIFVVWFGLILAAGLLIAFLRRAERNVPSADEDSR